MANQQAYSNCWRSQHTDFPEPTTGRSGWPWDVGSEPIAPTMSDGRPWPRITIVTPSFNQGQYLEETIRSILLQGYPNLEYILMDGGSTDNTIDTIKKYAAWISYWQTGQDEGQADAINQGFARASGDIVQWINSDDVLLPGALRKVAEAWDGDSIIAGSVREFGVAGAKTITNNNLTARNLVLGVNGIVFHQPGIWMSGRRQREIGDLPTKLKYCFDYVYIILYLERWPRIIYLNESLVAFRLHAGSKTVKQQDQFEGERRVGLKLVKLTALTNELRGVADQRLSQFAWWDFVAQKQGERFARGRIRIALEIARAAIRDPFQRLNRWTIGAIRNVLFG